MICDKSLIYLYYFFARNAPRNKLRLFCLNNIRYIQIGKDCYIGPGITITPLGGDYFDTTDEKPDTLLRLGERVAVGPNVSFLCSSGPEYSKLRKKYPPRFMPITIEDDVWIGAGSIILPGVTVHQCSVVGAGAVVTKDVPPLTVVAGSPAQAIKTLYESE